MKKIEFATLQMTIDHAKQFGGWIFYNEKENISIWYDATIYTMTMILKDSQGSGKIATWSEFENKEVSQETNQNVNVLDKKVIKKINDIVKYAQIAEYTITQEMTIEKLHTMVEQFGEEKAFNALDNTLKKFKQEAKQKENEMWSKVKLEVFKKNASVPTSLRVLKSMIKNNEININGIESQSWVENQLGIGA